MDGPEQLTLADALDVIRDALREQLKITGRLPSTVVTVGGTALAALHIRERSAAIDVYMSEIDDAAISAVQDKYRHKHGLGFKIDATPVNTLWGDIAINDIDQSPTVTTVQIEGFSVQIRSLSAETLYLIKVAADRPKDRTDVSPIALKCSLESLMSRAKQIFPWYADRSAFPEYAERLARCIARDFNIPIETVDAGFGLPGVVAKHISEIRTGLDSQFMALLEAVMAKRPDLISPVHANVFQMRFDAEAAGVPQEVLDVIRKHPREASDMAINVLKTSDPKRHMDWLLSVARAAKSPTSPQTNTENERRIALANEITAIGKASGLELPDNVEENLVIYVDERSLRAMANDVQTALSFQNMLDAHSIVIPSDDNT